MPFGSLPCHRPPPSSLLVEVLFHEDKHAALRRSVTSLLAGDVFGDQVWLRDAKKRIAAMLAE